MRAKYHIPGHPVPTLCFLLVVCIGLSGCSRASLPSFLQESLEFSEWSDSLRQTAPVSSFDIPEYSGSPYVELNNNVPQFSSDAYTQNSYEYYSALDYLGRCGTAAANVCSDTMPTEERGSIGQIKPSGWHTVKYEDLIEDRYLYNRCHLIGFQLTGENDNEKNLITGTRYMNIEGMLPFENEIGAYVRNTGNHVLYRVTPIFQGTDLVARGVQMEAESVEDNGAGIKFNVFCYNVQPGIAIDYRTGESWAVEE